MDILRIENLEKSFNTVKVIDGLSFSVPENSVFGFIGQNGAGKTTTMKMALGLLKPDGGRIEVCGEPVEFGRNRTNRYIGYLPDVPAFYGYMKPREYLRLCGQVTGMPEDRIRQRSAELLALVGLERANKRIGGFSRGMKQRLGFAQALLNEPRLLICDEPTSALDPIGRKEILDIIRQIRGKSTVVFSTHILSDVERICDQIAVIDHGRIVLAGTLSELKAQHRQDRLAIDFATADEAARFLALPAVRALAGQTGTSLTKPEGSAANGSGLVLQARDITGVAAAVLQLLTESQLLPVRFEILEPTIESLFLEAVR